MLLLIDIGTTTFKAALWDGAFSEPVSINMEENTGEAAPENSGECETSFYVDPSRWLRAFERALERLEGAGKTRALVVSGNGPTLVPVTGEPGFDSLGRLSLEAAPARHWLDRRAAAEAETISAHVGAFVDPGFYLPKALMIKNREAALYEKTRFFLSSSEYLVYALTGEARTVFPSEGFERWYWDEALLEKTGLDREKFPPFVFPGEYIGDLLPGAAARFGFGSHVKVFAGGPDFFMTILGAGVSSPGQVCDRSGTSEGINLCTRDRVTDSRLMSYGHPVKPFWNLSGIISTSGKAIAWARELLGLEKEPYGAFYDLAAAAERGSLLFLPYLAGERAPVWDPAARGVFMGLSLSTGRKEMARAAAEGVCLAIRDVITVMEECGAEVSELRVTGGPSANPFFNRLKADVTGKTVLRLAGPPSEIAGLAVTGAVALGYYGSFKEAAEALVQCGEAYHPDPGAKPVYDKLFENYRELYQRLRSLY
jgi:xylulokinase